MHFYTRVPVITDHSVIHGLHHIYIFFFSNCLEGPRTTGVKTYVLTPKTNCLLYTLNGEKQGRNWVPSQALEKLFPPARSTHAYCGRIQPTTQRTPDNTSRWQNGRAAKLTFYLQLISRFRISAAITTTY
jgi:hypothetical protein